MKITKQEVLHVARLARLDIDERDIDAVSAQLSKILEYVDMLNRVDTDGVPPTSHAIFLTNAFREDSEPTHMEREKVLANAPEEKDGNFVVPRVIE